MFRYLTQHPMLKFGCGYTTYVYTYANVSYIYIYIMAIKPSYFRALSIVREYVWTVHKFTSTALIIFKLLCCVCVYQFACTHTFIL